MGRLEEKLRAVPRPTCEMVLGTAGVRGRKWDWIGRERAVLTGREKPCWIEEALTAPCNDRPTGTTLGTRNPGVVRWVKNWASRLRDCVKSFWAVPGAGIRGWARTQEGMWRLLEGPP